MTVDKLYARITLLGHRTVAVLQIKWRTLTASMVSLMISLHWVAIEIYRCMWDEGMMCLRISVQKKIAICLVFLAKMQLKWFPIENGYWTGRRRYLVLLSTALGDFENGYWLNENGNWQNENGTWINLSTVLAQVIVRELTWFFFLQVQDCCATKRARRSYR